MKAAAMGVVFLLAFASVVTATFAASGADANAIEAVRSKFAAFNKHDADAIERIYASDATLSSPDYAHLTGNVSIADTYRKLFAAIPDAQDDVETILAETPVDKQVALFSATIPSAIRRIAKRYLIDAVEVTVKTKTVTAAGTRQRYLQVSHGQKLDALTRILEVEAGEAMIVFVRTKQATEDLAERLRSRGFNATKGDWPADWRRFRGALDPREIDTAIFIETLLVRRVGDPFLRLALQQQQPLAFALQRGMQRLE